MTAVLERVRGGIDGTARRLLPRPALEHVLLITVSLGYCLLILWRTSQSMPLTYDEVVYASQVSPDLPPAEFSAHRARGMQLLLAPVVAVTDSVFALRCYLVVLAGLGIYLAFRPWLGVLPGGRYRFVAPLAAALFATLWVTILYGTQGYPNLWVAFALIAGVGWCCRAMTGPRIGPVIGVAVAFAAASLIRPTDALAVAGPLLVAPLLVREWRRIRPWLAVVAGLLGGWLPWLIEAYTSFGGPLQRLRDGGQSTGSGLVNSLPANLYALDGPEVLCRPASECAGVDPLAAAWWFALPVLVVAGLVVAARTGWPRYAVLATTAATATALAVAGPYLFLLDYAAPRFLLTAYGLLAIPAAAGLLWLTGLGRREARVLTTTLVAAGLLLQLMIQLDVLRTIREPLDETARRQSTTAAFLRDEQDVRAPCLIWGEGAVQLSYPLRCRSVWEQGGDAPSGSDPDLRAALARGEDVVVRIRADESGELPGFMSGWRRVELPGDDYYVAYLPPPSR